MRLTQIIEALLFASDAPLAAGDLSRVDERLDEDTVEAVVDELRAEYDAGERSFQIYEVAGGYQILTRPEFISYLSQYDTVPQSSRLSSPALEVLAIIAYRQPIGRAEVEEIRGVGSSGVLRTLLDRSLVETVGRSEGLGRPLLYGTTSKFLEHLGFRSLEDLPRPDELPVVLRERPVAAAASPPGEPGAQEPNAPAAGVAEPTSAADAMATEGPAATAGDADAAAPVEGSGDAVTGASPDERAGQDQQDQQDQPDQQRQQHQPDQHEEADQPDQPDEDEVRTTPTAAPEGRAEATADAEAAG